MTNPFQEPRRAISGVRTLVVGAMVLALSACAGSGKHATEMAVKARNEAVQARDEALAAKKEALAAKAEALAARDEAVKAWNAVLAANKGSSKGAVARASGGRPGSARSGSEGADASSARAGSSRSGSARAGSSRSGSARAGSSRSGSALSEKPGAVSVGTEVKPPVSADGVFTPDAVLEVCPRITVTNRPKTDDQRRILVYKPFVTVGGKVAIAVAPHNNACLTSGFGQRRNRLHKGLDYQGKGRTTVMIHAAAEGTVKEKEYHDVYGNYVLLDHGDGVFTRYAHLKGFHPQVKVGAKLPFGAKLGRMGRTGKYKPPLHLHYEVLVGEYKPAPGPRGFKLEPVNLFSLLQE